MDVKCRQNMLQSFFVFVHYWIQSSCPPGRVNYHFKRYIAYSLKEAPLKFDLELLALALQIDVTLVLI